jgi:hypothetical protein
MCKSQGIDSGALHFPAGLNVLRFVVCAPYGLRQQDDEDTPTVTFPDDYPNSVRHFLLIGFLGMFIGAIVFFYMGISRKVNTVMHVLTFFIAAVSACAYYAEWAGLGVEYKTTDTTPRVIFWAHYLDWVITGPVSAVSLFFARLKSTAQSGVGTRRGVECSEGFEALESPRAERTRMMRWSWALT